MDHASADDATATVIAAANDDLPGDLAIWIFILAELLAFGVLFVVYAFARSAHVELFDSMQETLSRRAGMVNTLLLLAASWCVARACSATRRDHERAASRWLAGGLACGGGFLVVKIAEYADKFAAGIGLSTNLFYMFYLSLTFFHLMHVILGMVILAALWLKTRRGGYSAASHAGLESGAAYWHMVDLVWLILFPLVYVMR